MNLGSIKSLNCFEACDICPLGESYRQNNDPIMKNDVGVFIRTALNAPGILIQNIEPTEAALEYNEQAGLELGEFAVKAWRCARIKQRNECKNPLTTNITPDDRYL